MAVLSVALLLLGWGCQGGNSGTEDFPGPWGANVVSPDALVKELAGPDKPVVVCTGPPVMYRMGHVPGAILHGPTSEPSAVSELTAWAQSLPKNTSLVIYCGCCPIAHCPTLRPAYAALKDLGFTRLRVLRLPENFGTDWVDRGFPVQR
jgi:thiosulfate/3-mercaptopyruvate sulfurtransferase